MRFFVVMALCVCILALVGCRPQLPAEVDVSVDTDAQQEGVDTGDASAVDDDVDSLKSSVAVVPDPMGAKEMDGTPSGYSGSESEHAVGKSGGSMGWHGRDSENHLGRFGDMGGSRFLGKGMWGPVCGVGRLSVRATGRVDAEPDLAVLRVSVSVEDSSVATAREQVAVILDGAVAAFRAHGVAEGDLSTSGFTVRTSYDFTDEGRVIRGYQVSHKLTAEYRDMDQIGVLIDAVSAAGGDTLFFEGVWLQHDDAEGLSDQARNLAVVELMRRAEMISESAGRELGPLISLDDGYTSSKSFGAAPYEIGMLASKVRAKTQVLVGDRAVEASVSGEFVLMPVKDSEYCGRMSRRE